MPSPIAHSVAGYLVTSHPTLKKHLPRQVLSIVPIAAFYSVVISNLPDLDFLPQIVTGLNFHRGPSHSLLAAILVSGLLALMISYVRPRIQFKMLFGITFGLYSAHLLMDMFTAGGKGIPLLWPLSAQFVRSPLPLFPAVHHSRGLWDSSHLIFIGVELLYTLILLVGIRLAKTRGSSSQVSVSSR
ncbi:MAG: metal-dependent hydrolase [Phormidesmis sp.]